MSNTCKFVRMDLGREIDRSDDKWVHPLLRNQAVISASIDSIKDWFDPSVPVEERREKVNAGVAPYVDFFMKSVDTEEARAQGDWLTLTVDEACPEEPGAAPFELFVRMPKDAKGRQLPCIMLIGGGALAYSLPQCWVSMMLRMSMENDAVVISPRYRPALEARYPAAINDIHAAYAWAVAHADELHIDPDCIALAGNSSGGHLAIASSFRLKRYGFEPRGCVTTMPITDERMDKPVSRVFMQDGDWDGVAVHLSALQWLGAENLGSPMVGPEAFANHATVEDCKGLCPQLLTTAEFDPDSDYCLEFIAKCKRAGVFCDLHLWGGTNHSRSGAIDPDSQKYQKKIDDTFYAGIKDCLENDLRRPWTAE